MEKLKFIIESLRCIVGWKEKDANRQSLKLSYVILDLIIKNDP